MNEILSFFSDNKDAVSSIGIICTFFVSAVSLYFSKRNNRAIHYVNAITKNRVEWIYKLREYISEYVNLTTIDKHKFLIHGEEELSLYFEKLRLKRINIELLLNFTEDLDNTIISIIKDLEEKSLEFYGILYLIESISDDDLSDKQKDELVAHSTFARKYIIDYLQNQGFNYDGQDIDEYLFSVRLLADINKLRKEEKIVSWVLGLGFYINNLIENINLSTRELVQLVQVYLKFEWNRVKYEGEGKIYYKGLQKFDTNTLLLRRKNSKYKVNKIKRNYIKISLFFWAKKFWFLFAIIFLLFLNFCINSNLV